MNRKKHNKTIIITDIFNTITIFLCYIKVQIGHMAGMHSAPVVGQHQPHADHPDIGNIGVQGSLGHGSSGSQLIHPDFNNETPATEMLTPEQIDAILMRHDQVR